MKKAYSLLFLLMLFSACEESTETTKDIHLPLLVEDQMAQSALGHRQEYRLQQSYPFSLGGDSRYSVSHFSHDSLAEVYEVYQDAGDYGHQKTQYFLKQDTVFLILEEGYRNVLKAGNYQGEFYERRIYLKNEKIDSASEQTAATKEQVNLALPNSWEPAYLTEGQLHQLWMLENNFKKAPQFQWTFQGIQNVGAGHPLFLLKGEEHRQAYFYIDAQSQDPEILEVLANPARYVDKPVKVRYSMQAIDGGIQAFLDEIIWLKREDSPK
ncbi:hypothetical protein [Persicobacter diffluens]|uniref:Uncharacterized protein n=1 Tax=Persicobacter diffluens TaxID=981 RepID=A0AAN4W3Q7_9BACT|nr:hypothetical protein PEDI_42890 [Persicobacter diffluens]